MFITIMNGIIRLLLFQLSLTLPIFISDFFNIYIVIMDHSPSHAPYSISNRKSILRISELSKHLEWLSISFPFWKGFCVNCFYVRSESFDFTISNFALSVNSCTFRFSNNNLFIDFVYRCRLLNAHRKPISNGKYARSY